MIYSFPIRPTFGKDAIAYWEGFLTQEDINLILSQPEWLNPETACVGGSGQTLIVDPNIRKSEVSWVAAKPELLPIWEKIAHAAAEVNRRYFHYDLTGFYEPMQLSVYKAGQQGHYDWHTDASYTDSQVPRKLSVSILLSDPSEFEGGELQVKTSSDQAVPLEALRGRAWFFSSFTLHRVTPVTKGTRRSLVLWIGGPEFR